MRISASSPKPFFPLFVLALLLHQGPVAGQTVTSVEHPSAGEPPTDRTLILSVDDRAERNLPQRVGGTGISATFIVTDPNDLPADSVPVFNPPTLRAAIQCANFTPEKDLISIQTLAGTLPVNSPLPGMSQPVDVNGNGKTLDFSGMTVQGIGLFLNTDNSSIYDVEIVNLTATGFAANVGIALQGSNDTIRGVRIHNVAGTGINANNATGCLIGGPGVYDRNEITGCSGNSGTGIAVLQNSNGNTITNNVVGNDGTNAIPNSRYGVHVRGQGNRIIGNILSGNDFGGIELAASFGDTARNTLIEGNHIGLNLIGDSALGSQEDGIYVGGGVDDTIRFNVIGGNGIGIDASTQPRGTVIEGNLIGINRFDMVLAQGTGIRVGGADFVIRDNVISGNGTGIALSGTNSTAAIAGNLIGTDSTGLQARPNTTGIYAATARPCTVGGPLASDRNVISGNTSHGIWLAGADSMLIAGNSIGTNLPGTAALANENGIFLQFGATGSRIAGNVISGNVSSGITMTGMTTAIPGGNIVTGNYVGLAANGTDTIPNRGRGIQLLRAAGNSIGGTGATDRNYIGGNLGHGIYLLDDSSTGNVIVNNSIGTGITGAPAGNLDGIVIEDAAGNTVGGSDSAAANLIAYNTADGIHFAAAASGNTVLNNEIRNNLLDGVKIADSSHGNSIEDNRIHANDDIGISVRGVSEGNHLFHNSLHSNGALGIDLAGDAVTPNDPGDDDTGPNARQNAPVILLAIADTVPMVYGELRSHPLASFEVDLYANAACDPSGFGEGEIHVGSLIVQTDASGTARFGMALPLGTSFGFVTATATDSSGSTSEFSACRQADPPGLFADLSVTVSDDIDTAGVGDTVICRITVRNDGPDTVFSVLVSDIVSENVAVLADSFAAAPRISDVLDTLIYNYPSLAPGAEAAITLYTLIIGPGAAIHLVRASGTGAVDYLPGNNDDEDTTSVGPATDIRTEDGARIPEQYFLAQNYPNPFNPSTVFRLELPQGGRTSLTVYTTLGAEAAVVFRGELPPGVHHLPFDAAGLPSGVYFYRVRSGDFIDVKKMVLIR